jgi:hypothetical protein
VRTLLPAIALAVLQAQAPPDTDIYLASLSSAGGVFTVGTPLNITSSPGYDNQPSFNPDGSAVLFASVRGSASIPPPGGPGGTQTDVYRYDIAAGKVTRITSTAESEYSPAVMPGGQRISVVRVEADGTQRLWSFTPEGGEPALVLSDVKPVGYHAWLDDHTVALFVLGQPATLQVADTRSGRAETLATNIGRSVLRTPSASISFVQREPRGEGATAPLTIREIGARERQGGGRASDVIARVPAGGSDPDLAWMPDGTLLMSRGGTLYACRRGSAEWTAVFDLTSLGLTSVSRLAVSPAGDRIALVAQSK